jgi:hypothetical protein
MQALFREVTTIGGAQGPQQVLLTIALDTTNTPPFRYEAKVAAVLLLSRTMGGLSTVDSALAREAQVYSARQSLATVGNVMMLGERLRLDHSAGSALRLRLNGARRALCVLKNDSVSALHAAATRALRAEAVANVIGALEARDPAWTTVETDAVLRGWADSVEANQIQAEVEFFRKARLAP